ncbi:arsenate reductase family protein [Lacinutrix cladophorae]
MGVIATNKREIKLYYNSKTAIGKQTLPYAQASNKKLLAIDLSKTKVTGTQWIEIAENLKMPLADLVHQKHPDFTKNYSEKNIDLNTEDWIKVLQKHPETLKCSILNIGNHYHLLETPSDFIKYMKPDSKALNP